MRASGTGIDLQSVMLTVIVMAIVLYTGMAVMQTVTEAQIKEIEENGEEIDTVCAGVMGCGQSPYGLAGPLVITVILAVILTYVHSLQNSVGREPDDETKAKQQYVEGEISLLELEERLEDDIDEDDL